MADPRFNQPINLIRSTETPNVQAVGNRLTDEIMALAVAAVREFNQAGMSPQASMAIGYGACGQAFIGIFEAMGEYSTRTAAEKWTDADAEAMMAELNQLIEKWDLRIRQLAEKA